MESVLGHCTDALNAEYCIDEEGMEDFLGEDRLPSEL